MPPVQTTVSSLKRELASDAAPAARPAKRASPSSDSSSSANFSIRTGGALSTRISYNSFRDLGERKAGADYLTSPSSPQLPATNSSDDMLDGSEFYEDTIEDSPLAALEKHLGTDQDTQQDEAPASSSPVARLGRALAASKGLKQSASPEYDLADEGILVQPEIMDDTNEHILPMLPLAQRQQFYAHLYADRIIALKNLAYPPECRRYPKLAAEIAQAYLTHVTITVKIWTNYDSYTKHFFQDAFRAQDCGKISLTPRQRARVQNLLRRGEMGKVRLEIGTPFRTLCELNITCCRDGQQGSHSLGVTGLLREDMYGPHNLLTAFAERNRETILTDGLAGDGTKRGLTLGDVDEIAKDFVCKPRSYAEQQQWFFD